MTINTAAIQPDLPIGVTVLRRHVWDMGTHEIVILELSDGSMTVNGEPVAGRPEFDGLTGPPSSHAEDTR